MGKTKINITIEPDQLKWIDEEVKRQTYANRSHAIRVAIKYLADSKHTVVAQDGKRFTIGPEIDSLPEKEK